MEYNFHKQTLFHLDVELDTGQNQKRSLLENSQQMYASSRDRETCYHFSPLFYLLCKQLDAHC